MKLQENMTIISQKEIAKDIFELVLSGEIVQDLEQTGQFLNVKVASDSLLLRRPISISEWDKAAGTLTLLYRIGDATSGTKLISDLTAGEKVDVMGPLGKGFDISEVVAQEQVLLVGGGIGVPPLYELAKKLSKTGCKIKVLLGFASEQVKILDQKFANLANTEVLVTTDDGSFGAQGHIGNLLETLDFTPDAVYTCGSPMMLKSVASKYDGLDRLFISTEARMACGIGACYACVVHTKDDPTGEKGHALKVCEDGPVFKGKELAL